MKLSAWTGRTVLAVASLGVAIVAVAGISGCNKTDPNKPTEIKTAAITMPQAYKVPPGADPSVPAEMGGKGFEKIAADSGWKTANITPEDANLMSDSNARKGGMVTMGIDEFPATFRAYGRDENTQETRAIHDMVYEPLLHTNPLTLDFLPCLATHWKVGPDNQTYYFRINPDARFSDGHPVTSADVLATFKIGKDPGILDPFTNTFFDGFDPPVAISKYIVSVHSKTNNWKNMFYFAGNLILPAHVLDTINGTKYLERYQYEMPPGTGPYVVVSADINKGNSVTLTRRADWWLKDDQIGRNWYNFDKVKFMVIRDENLRLEKFLKGEIDFYYVNRASYWVEKFKGTTNDLVARGIIQRRKIYNDKPTGFGGIAFNTQRTPFNDPKMRQVFTLLFNRKDLVEKLMFNEYELSDSYYPNSVYANPNNPKQQYDPARAAQLLAELGYASRNSEGILVKDGKPLEVEVLVQQPDIRILTPYQQDLLKAGIKANFRTMDPTSKFKMLKEKNYQLSFMQWGGIIYPNPISSFKSTLNAGSSSNNVTAFHNPLADELMDREQITFDQAERVRMIRELDSILVAENTYALAYHVPFVRLAFWNKFSLPNFTLGRISDWDEALIQWWYDPAKADLARKGAGDKSVKMDVGEPIVRFWPEWDAKHPPQSATTAAAAAPQPSKAPGGTTTPAAKPTLK